jgi:hypothetical protein
VAAAAQSRPVPGLGVVTRQAKVELTMMLNQDAQRRRNDPETRMSDAVAMSDVGDLADHIALSELDREQFPRWIRDLSEAEANARRLRVQLEEILAGPSRQ